MPNPSDLPEDAVLAAHCDAAAALLGLKVVPEWREEVLVNLRTLAAAHALVAAHPLEDAAEPAPVFAA